MTEIKPDTPPRTLPPLVMPREAGTSDRRRGSLVDTILDELRIGSGQGNEKTNKKKLSRQSSSGEKKNSDLKQAESKGDRKHARRDSIKEHLMKFRMKAGKVLEEVHERLVEDHSGTPVSPLTPTHSSTTVLDFQEDETSVNEERVLSPTFSQSSKKTTSSDELKASLRSKIRKQAEKVVERKRGSVQLTRRLKRRLTTHMEDMPTEHDIENVDSQIENSIKLGLRFDHTENSSVFPSYNEQYSFCTKPFSKTGGKRETSSMLQYAKAQPHLENESLLTYDGSPNLLSEVEQLVGRKHVPSSMLPHEEIEIGTEKWNNFRWEVKESEDLVYVPALNNLHSEVGDEVTYSDVKIQLDSLIANSSDDETDEDKLASHLRLMYSELIFCVRKMNTLFDTFQEVSDPDRLTRILNHSQNKMVDSFKESYIGYEQQLNQSLNAVNSAWEALERQRQLQGYCLTNFSLLQNESENDENKNLSPIPRLLRNYPVTAVAKLPAEDRKRIEARRKRKFFITILFNDKVVGKTKSFKFGESLCCKIAQTFHMEVFSEYNILRGIIFEKGLFRNKLLGSLIFTAPKKNAGFTREVSTFQSPNEKNSARFSGSLVYQISHADCANTISRSLERNERNAELEHNSGFQLIPQVCRLVTDEEFDSNVRWEILERRFRMKLSLKSSDLSRIGLDSSEVDASILYNEEKKPGSGYRSGIDGHRMTANNHYVSMRRRILESVFETSDNVQYEQIVREEPLGASFSLGNLFGPPDLSRKLKPMRKEYSRQQTINVNTCHLIINIQSAMNLPLRNNGSLQSLVECSFQNKKVMTKPAIGKHPNWQQTFRLTVDTANIDLRSITDNIEIKIYDQTVSKLDFDDREMNSIHEQLVRHFIGCIQIPFSSVYCRGKVDGGIRIQFPLIQTGYSAPSKGSYMKLIVALDPSMMPPTLLPHTGLDTVEPNKIIGQCVNWEKNLRSQFTDRKYNATVLDVCGKRVLSSRYLRPIKPPPCIENLSQSLNGNSKKFLELITATVSYMPFVSDPVLFPGVIDMWMSADQFVNIGCGDEEEHAVLLCCWLLHLQYPSYVVLGSALPEGDRAAFVLTNTNEDILLLNPTDGNVYSIGDVMCPLSSIGTVISPMNVYGNIQPSVHCSQMSFDFTKTVHWKPLFDKDMLQLDSIQPASLSYNDVSEDSIMELRASIEREIKVSFDDARQFAIPQWNLMTSRILREVLQEIDNVSVAVLDEKLMRLRESYNITVTAIRIPYQSLQHCIRSVLSLDLHINTDTSAQFALAVHINPYFNNIISCSIALGMLTLKR